MTGKKKVMVAAVFLMALILLAAGAFMVRHRGSGKGVKLEICETISPPEMVYYLQRDEEWAKDYLGNTRYTMGSSGCLVSCIASLLSIYDVEVTPGELNRLFTENSVYNDSGDVIWANISKVYPDLRVEVPGSVDASAIEQLLKEQRYPLVRVKNLGDGYWHWVLLIGSDENGYLCMDPLYGEKKARPLAAHGDTIYSYRVVYDPQ